MSADTKRLRELAHAAADCRWSEFSMRVPADHERDADLVLMNAAEELDRLRAENAELRQSLEVRDTEIARLQKDAGRYAFLKRYATSAVHHEYSGIPMCDKTLIATYRLWSFAGPLAWLCKGETLDAAIDAARGGGNG